MRCCFSRLKMNNLQILEPRTGRAGYAGPGQWFPGRSDRQGDKQKGDRGGAYQVNGLVISNFRVHRK